MVSKAKKNVLLALVMIGVLCFFAGCQFGPTLDGEKNKYDLSALITYHANGGTFNNNKDFADLWYKDGSYALNVGIVSVVVGDISVTYPNHTLEGWYFAQTDENGDVVYTDDTKTTVKLGEPFDFKTALQKGDQIHLYAHWVADQQLKFLLAAEESIDDQLAYGDVTFNVGDVLNAQYFDASGRIEQPTLDQVTKTFDSPEGYVFAEYYYDAECEKPVSWPVNRSESEEVDSVSVYVKYLSDEWTVVESANDLKKMFGVNAASDGKYFIKNDIVTTYSYTKITASVNATFSGEIRGNGYTISGVSVTQAKVGAGESVSLFGKLAATAKISDLTLDNFKLEFTANEGASVHAYFLATEIETGATVQNLIVNGGSMRVRLNEGETCNGKTPNKETPGDCPITGTEHDGIGINVAPEMNFTIR